MTAAQLGCDSCRRDDERTRALALLGGLIAASRSHCAGTSALECRHFREGRMSLSPGTRLGSFEILSRLGPGGRGDVYRAIAPARVERNRA